VERTSVARKGSKRRGETQQRANARVAAGSWQIQQAVQSAFEQLEGRQLFSSTIQPSTDGVAGNYFAWQAETAFKQVPDAAGNLWNPVSTPDITGMASPSAGATGATVNGPGLQWTLKVATAGNYKLYVRRTITGGQNSFWAPAVDATSGIGTAPFVPVADVTKSRFDEAADTAVPTWSSQRGATGDFATTNTDATKSFVTRCRRTRRRRSTFAPARARVATSSTGWSSPPTAT